jgi:hypothetical protein
MVVTRSEQRSAGFSDGFAWQAKGRPQKATRREERKRMEKDPQFEYAIICDDIRHEVGDKFSLIGVYGSHVYVAQLPFLFPKLSAAISYRNMKAGHTFAITLQDPSGQTVGKPILGEVPEEVTGLTRFMIFGVFPPLHVTQSGRYTLFIVINEDEATKQHVGLVIQAADKHVVH